MATRNPMAVGEWYHCYNRGIDKRKIFQGKDDYERFLSLMYVGNSSIPIHISNLKSKKCSAILRDESIDRGEPLVEIGAYALMPNHLHFVFRETRESGIALFMQKVFTGYTMYFNKKYERTGALLAGTFKSKHVKDDRYLKWLVSYIHLNPVELIEPHWKEGRGNLLTIERALKNYSYSSLIDFGPVQRSERKILNDSVFKLFDSRQTTKELLDDARAYYRESIKV